MSLWQSIADNLRAEIARGLWPPGTKLPAEAELAARFGVNRHTLRHATKVLADEGLLYSRRGAGVFVAASPVDYPLGDRVRFHRNIELAGKVPGRVLDAVMTRPSDAAEASALGLSTGDKVHVAEGVSMVDFRPVALFRTVFPADWLPDLPAALRERKSVTAALSACGIDDYRRISTRVTARIADATQAVKLQIDPGEPLLRTEAISESQGRPVEHGLTWWAAERVTLTLPHDIS
ncbi:phosphonate metabolism transcriptional regulator PhnF [Paracoccus saliphilus]|uniref:Phosphonate metabolism transcriptional regulator PhnF n=1 Tax=Paracoccus saliphilus TaxID=405559 RepID=A0AA45W1F4_9RHOB|nr:phosphonate metabolism transcriptional regulator PhnF [Paracoccus saliphilus]WCR03606.1 phosphonate metabolism transcriptional regulator PhnF [Paracoccus saliphilus]SIS56534.1 transcriptional regulator, GntR family [Paracoccus saliphilus]